jgi:hypothetical protein
MALLFLRCASLSQTAQVDARTGKTELFGLDDFDKKTGRMDLSGTCSMACATASVSQPKVFEGRQPPSKHARPGSDIKRRYMVRLEPTPLRVWQGHRSTIELQ